ncbi:MAG: prepilin peptidase, partial [Candidatus Nanopelagicales bacterium]
MTWQALFIALVYGTAVSWFAQLLIERVPAQEPLRGKLRCATCAARLGWYEQFPVVGWMVRRGRCRACGARLGLRRVLVELLCVLLTLSVVTSSLPGILALTWLLFVPVAVALWFIDIDHKRLPDLLTLPAAGAALLMAAVDAS